MGRDEGGLMSYTHSGSGAGEHCRCTSGRDEESGPNRMHRGQGHSQPRDHRDRKNRDDGAEEVNLADALSTIL